MSSFSFMPGRIKGGDILSLQRIGLMGPWYYRIYDLHVEETKPPFVRDIGAEGLGNYSFQDLYHRVKYQFFNTERVARGSGYTYERRVRRPDEGRYACGRFLVSWNVWAWRECLLCVKVFHSCHVT